MLSARGLFTEILENDDSFSLFCSIAASGESQGGWENSRIAALVPASQRGMAPKIARHGADEDKHGRIFLALLHKRELETVPVPPDTDYTMLLERAGIGLTHARLRQDEALSEQDIVTYLAHSRVTEQRASEQMRLLLKHFGDHPELGRAVRAISHDEDNHLAYCHEELLRLARSGHARSIHRILRDCAHAEIRVYRDVSISVMNHMADILGWSHAKIGTLRSGIHAVYAYERAVSWRRMTSLTWPADNLNALGATPPSEPVTAKTSH
ncbi:ferritin-like domain-containing protein [Streptomyces sp. NBC_01190]|uniref:ferritin-like domain-containing protein n=1 Tax=Streptomyces sp. NBC_01190 TaxID=2903767 RepID=UPI0038654587|nr:ferritin-like domain-containing protein [Streptomyces sp. NBC_01190]